MSGAAFRSAAPSAPDSRVPGLFCNVLSLFVVLVFIRIIASWFPIAPGSPMASAFSFLYAITEPVLGPIRRVLPGIGAGGMQLDLSPIIVIIVVQVLKSAVGC
jgi:YggT family protein